MVKKILVGFVAAAIMGDIFAAGVEIGRNMKERSESSTGAQSAAPDTNG